MSHMVKGKTELSVENAENLWKLCRQLTAVRLKEIPKPVFTATRCVTSWLSAAAEGILASELTLRATSIV